MLSTRSRFNNPIYTTYPLSILSTQPSDILNRGFVSVYCEKQKNPSGRTAVQTVRPLGNPFISTLFRTLISRPLTSILPSQHGGWSGTVQTGKLLRRNFSLVILFDFAIAGVFKTREGSNLPMGRVHSHVATSFRRTGRKGKK